MLFNVRWGGRERERGRGQTEISVLDVTPRFLFRFHDVVALFGHVADELFLQQFNSVFSLDFGWGLGEVRLQGSGRRLRCWRRRRCLGLALSFFGLVILGLLVLGTEELEGRERGDGQGSWVVPVASWRGGMAAVL